ncbi:MAG: MFS transporter [Actinomycetia bacterium]|nr:MFS transporter [Actinomycetes bacterium]
MSAPQIQRPPAGGEVPSPFGPAYRLVTVSILALVTIIAFESMAISTVMPEVADDLNAVRSYGLAFSVMLTAQLLGIVLAGVWVDRSGPMPAIMIGQVLLGVGSFICGAALRLEMLLLGRALAGLGAGLLVVVFFVVIGRVYPEAVRPRLFGMVSAAWVVPSLLGPPIAAWIALHLSWRWVFWIVIIPIAVVAPVLMTKAHLVEEAGAATVSNRDHRSHVRAAWLGLLIALAAGAVQLGTHELELEWSGKTVLACLGVVGLIITAPLLLPAGTWVMRRGLPSVILARFLASLAFFGTITFVPLYLVNERGLTIGEAGLMLAVGSLGWAGGAWIQGQHRWDGRREQLISLGGLGLIVGVIGLALSAWLTLPVPVYPLCLVVMGLGMGMATATTSVLMLMLASGAEHAEASTALNLADVLGSVTGIAAIGAVFAALHTQPGGDAHVFGIMWTVTAAAALVLILTGRRIRPSS